MGVQIHSAEAHLDAARGRPPHRRRRRGPQPPREACGEDLHHQRADDLPPYIVITIVGHIIVGGLLLAEKFGDWPMWLHMVVWPALTLILSIAMMQPVKGGVVGLQWAVRMHGFGGEPDRPERQPLPSSESRS